MAWKRTRIHRAGAVRMKETDDGKGPMRSAIFVVAFFGIAILALAVLIAEDGGIKAGWIAGERRSQAGQYEGQHKDGKRHGSGVLTFPNSDRFEGRFVSGEIRGKGVLRLANGDIYASDQGFGPDGLEGCGVYVGSNGHRYRGEFQGGRFHGRGTYEWNDGTGVTCDWNAGVRVEATCLAHPAVGIGTKKSGDGVCGSLGDNNILGMETRRQQRECRERFRGDSARYKECRARVRAAVLSNLRVRER